MIVGVLGRLCVDKSIGNLVELETSTCLSCLVLWSLGDLVSLTGGTGVVLGLVT